MKDHSATPESLVDGWRQRAAELSFDCEQICDRLNADTITPRPIPLVHLTPMFEHLAGPDGLTRNRSTFGRREVIQGICDHLPNGASISDICDWADRFIDSEHCTRLTGTKSAVIRTNDGRTVSARTDETRFSTPGMLATERRLIATAVERVNAGVGAASSHLVGTAIAQRPSMSDEQAEMVSRVCTSGSGVDLVEGVAGAGKTFALAAANQAWTDSGYTVIGCALAAKAARQLQTDADIPSHTIDRLLIDLDRTEHGGLAPNTVIVVDEAAMVGTRKILRLLDHAQRADAKVVLVGDPCQLPEIEAGGAFVGLRHRLNTSHLDDNRRQREPWERAALARLRSGDTNTALDTYIQRGRVQIAPTAAEARSRMVGDWLDARRTGTAVMLANRRIDVDALNRSARAALLRAGTIGPDQIVLAGHGYSEGALVVALRNDRQLGLLNGTRAVIDHIDTDARVMRCRTDQGQDATIPFDYAADGHLTHGYAMTIHKSQGATYDRCLVLAGDQLTKESAYTAMSRGRLENTLFLVDDSQRATEAHTGEIESSLVDRVRASIGRSGSQTMAIEHMRPASHDDDLDLGIDL